MNLYMLVSLIIIPFFMGCQQQPIKQNNPGQQCTDVNKNGICDNRDSDNDAILDEQEERDGTNPNRADTDGDGRDDLCEKGAGTDPKDSTKFPETCSINQNPGDNPQNLPDTMQARLACEIYAAQKAQDEWLQESDIRENCVITNKELNTKTCSGEWNVNDNARMPINYGLEEEAELETINVTVKWGVSSRDVLIIANGIMTITPFWKFYDEFYDPDETLDGDSDNADNPNDEVDDVWFGHHLGMLPSTEGCPDEIKGKAEVKIVKGNETVNQRWFMPAFLPFKIKQYEDIYPFSIDAVRLSSSNYEQDGMKLLDPGINNFSYVTNIIIVENLSNLYNGWKTHFDRHNNTCKIREVSFSIQYYKNRPRENEVQSGYFDYSTLEAQCREILNR